MTYAKIGQVKGFCQNILRPLFDKKPSTGPFENGRAKANIILVVLVALHHIQGYFNAVYTGILCPLCILANEPSVRLVFYQAPV
jgi:hypothetical protein